MPKQFCCSGETVNPVSSTAKPKQAATVILLRCAEPNGFEVFLTRRPDSMPFLGGMYCFPGGTVQKDDCSEAIQRCCTGLAPKQARAIIGAHFSPREALGLWVAAIRELFEETGILLAHNDDNEPLRVLDGQTRLEELHDALLAKSLSFRELLEKGNLKCDLARLSHFSHWQTPSEVPMRFNTRFFLAALPEGQTPLPTSYEVVHSLWITPDRALAQFEKKQLPMIFPTFASLRTLADFESVDSLFREYGLPAAAA